MPRRRQASATLPSSDASSRTLDSQSVKTTEAGGPRGHDAGKKIKGRKRHAMVDTDGRPLVLQAHTAASQDRDGAVPLLKASRRSFPFVERAFADSAYGGDRVAEGPGYPPPAPVSRRLLRANRYWSPELA
ncbi:Mobile element protein [Lutibaculum baratangense AMV1]|uniref:Mobile element protein n=1 Tax=Lutibaculum baratangense AMV1 TaxID=631454 RepID=V4R8J7_9HYPH|nr:Mobile element protein [Lutibaculum baratangense AMV1]